MPRILIDGMEYQPAASATTWGSLLAGIDAAIAPDRRIVTDARFDGIDDPAFRDATALARPLEPLAVVEVISGTPATLMERCLGEAARSIDSLCEAALAGGELFRGHDVDAAGNALLALADGLSSLVGIVGAAGLALQVDLASVEAEGQTASGMVNELTAIINALISAQEAGDWITIADLLQYDVEPALRRWRPVLVAFPTQAAGQPTSATA